jgi:hypothetical protein
MLFWTRQELREEIARLKAEVERLQDFNDGLMAMRLQDEKGNLLTASDYARLKAEVERLTKAGDAIFINLVSYKDFIPDNGNTHHMINSAILEWNPKYGQSTEYGKTKEVQS